MIRKKRTTGTRSHHHDQSPSPDASPNRYLAGESESYSHLQGKKQKGQSSCSETKLGASSAEWGGGINPRSQTTTQVADTIRPGYLEDERRAKRKRRKSSPLAKQRRPLVGKGLQSDATEGSESPRKAFLADPWLWFISRKCLWFPFWLNFQGKRQKSSQVFLFKRGNRFTKTFQTDSRRFSSKLDTLKKDTGVSISCLLRDLITAENKKFKDYHKAAYLQPSWRPPIPVEDGIWVPNPVETNGEGRKRLLLGWGDPLVEVFDIKVDLRGRKKTFGHIHGNITMDCTVYRIVLFDCDKESAMMVQQKSSLPLEGSDIAPLGYDPICFIVNLKIDDDELCDDILVWNPSYHCTNAWLCDTLKGKKGSVHVTYAVVSQSWLAELDVRLITSTQKNGSKIYGDIVVYINGMSYLSSFIFSKRRDDIFIVEPMQPIPLSRSLFVCPHGSSLVVKINLWDSDANKALARGALLFPTNYYGDSVGEVRDIVQVKVNWGRYIAHSKTRETIALVKPNKPL